MPKVASDITVAIAVKDRRNDLLEAVASVATQTVFPGELIIVDDGSAVPVESDWFGELPFTLRIIRNDPNRGAAASYNRAVKEASSSVVVFLDSDDVLKPNYLEVVAARWQSPQSRPICLATGFDWCTNDLVPYRTQVVKGPIGREALLARGNVVGGCSVLSVDRAAFLAVGGYPGVRGSYDWGLMLRLTKTAPIDTIEESLVLYRSPTTNTLPNDTKNFRRQILATLAITHELTPADRRAARTNIVQMICYNLAQAGRRRMSAPLFWELLLRHKWDKMTMNIAVVMLLGRDRYNALLMWWAQRRAALNSRKTVLLR